MKIEVAKEIGPFERERWAFVFDAAYLRLTLSGFFSETRDAEHAPWEPERKPLPAELPAWVVMEARTNLAQRIDVISQ